MENNTSKRLLTVDEFAFLTAQKPRTIRHRIWRREIPYVKVGRNVRLRAELVNELIEAGTVPAIEALQPDRRSSARPGQHPDQLAGRPDSNTAPPGPEAGERSYSC